MPIRRHGFLLLLYFGSASVARTLRFVELLWPQPVSLYVRRQQVCYKSRSHKRRLVRDNLGGRQVAAKKAEVNIREDNLYGKLLRRKGGRNGRKQREEGRHGHPGSFNKAALILFTMQLVKMDNKPI